MFICGHKTKNTPSFDTIKISKVCITLFRISKWSPIQCSNWSLAISDLQNCPKRIQDMWKSQTKTPKKTRETWFSNCCILVFLYIEQQNSRLCIIQLHKLHKSKASVPEGMRNLVINDGLYTCMYVWARCLLSKSTCICCKDIMRNTCKHDIMQNVHCWKWSWLGLQTLRFCGWYLQ